MEFDITSFTKRIRELMYEQFPFENEDINQKKHAKRPEHIKDVAFKNNETMRLDDNTLVFEIGNPYAEEKYPYYHILEDAPAIRKRDRGTARTKGSQDKVAVAGGKRDYGRIDFNGKTFSKEYSRNVRGERNRRSNVSRWARDYMGRDYYINRDANAYENVHYQYIEKMLNTNILDTVALEFGLKRGRTQSTGLGEEYQAQQDEENQLVNILDSFD